MAMSRSIGARSLTTLSSIRTRPELMLSSPATMRNVVVLPQPEGPTSTKNSLSRISRFTSFTACTSSYILFKFRIRTRAIASSLHGTGEAGNVILDEERVDHGHWYRAEQRARHQRPPKEHVTADQLRRDADRNGLLLRRGQEHQRVDELVPRQREGEDAGREDARYRDREDDVDHRLPARRAVDPRALLELLGDGLEVAHQQPGAERDQEGRIGQDQRPRRVAEMIVADDVGERDEQ